MASEIHLRSPATTEARTKPAPKQSVIRSPFVYHPSDDGTDENLLILLHGLGESRMHCGSSPMRLMSNSDLYSCRRYARPFWTSRAVSKTSADCNLSITSPREVRRTPSISDMWSSEELMLSYRIPFLYEEAYQWYTSFDPLGELLDRPNPTPAIELLRTVLDHLVDECHWPPQRIHLFGFAQGGTVAVETCLQWWRSELEKQRQTDSQHVPCPLGTVVTVCGPLLSYPTLLKPCTTPLLVFQRPPPSELALSGGAMTDFKKGYSHLIETTMPGDGMPRSRQEWEPIMRFWSERLGRRPMEGLYEVMSGLAS